jgi:hypothetical protein
LDLATPAGGDNRKTAVQSREHLFKDCSIFVNDVSTCAHLARVGGRNDV